MKPIQILPPPAIGTDGYIADAVTSLQDALLFLLEMGHLRPFMMSTMRC